MKTLKEQIEDIINSYVGFYLDNPNKIDIADQILALFEREKKKDKKEWLELGKKMILKK